MAYQPFYIMNSQNQEENWEAIEEKDWEYMKGMYPQMAREIQEKVEEECDKLEYDGSMMFDEYPDKLMMRNICERIYEEMQDDKERDILYADDEEEMTNGAGVYPMNGSSSASFPMNEVPISNAADNLIQENESVEGESIDLFQGNRVCTSCQRRSPQGEYGWKSHSSQGGADWGSQESGWNSQRTGWGSPQGDSGFLPSHSSKGEARRKPHPSQGGSEWGSRPPHGAGFLPPHSGHGGWIPPRPPKRACSCPPGRPCRDCLVALQNQPDWMRDLIEVLLYQEMRHRRSRRRRRRMYQRNY